jgi:transposase-like protein
MDLTEVNPLSWTKESNLGGFTMTKFSFEVKLKAIRMYLAGIGSSTIARKLGIREAKSVQIWVARYRKYGVQGLEIRSPKFDYDGNFKLKVLNWRKQHEASYLQTALQFDISNPGTIANWQRKLKERGIEALFTRRGRATTNHNQQARKQLSELERLKAENRALKVENEYLKKLEALVQRHGQSKKNIKSSKN